MSDIKRPEHLSVAWRRTSVGTRCATSDFRQLLEFDLDALAFVSRSGSVGIHIEAVDRTDRVCRKRKYPFARAFILGGNVAKYFHALQEELVFRIGAATMPTFTLVFPSGCRTTHAVPPISEGSFPFTFALVQSD